MPFTASHPAIVLPLTFLPRRWYSLTGLVVGSMTPDFEYFLRMRLKSAYSHTLGGLFWFDLPLGLLLAFLFHVSVRNPLVNNLPAPIATRFSSASTFNWKKHLKANWIIVVVSILIGSASHILWDTLTHARSPLAEDLPLLASRVKFLGWSIPVATILQHGSTAIGGAVVAVAIWAMPVFPLQHSKKDLMYWPLAIGISAVIVGLRFLSGLTLNKYGNVIATLIGAGLVGIVFASLLLPRSIGNKENSR